MNKAAISIFLPIRIPPRVPSAVSLSLWRQEKTSACLASILKVLMEKKKTPQTYSPLKWDLDFCQAHLLRPPLLLLLQLVMFWRKKKAKPTKKQPQLPQTNKTHKKRKEERKKSNEPPTKQTKPPKQTQTQQMKETPKPSKKITFPQKTPPPREVDV